MGGRNEMGQLGVGDSKDHFVPQLVKEITGYDIVEVATGKSHTLFLTSCGKVLAAGSNEQGQCGQGRKTGNLETPKLVVHEGAADIVSVACGGSVSCWTRKGRSGHLVILRMEPLATMMMESSCRRQTKLSSDASTAPYR